MSSIIKRTTLIVRDAEAAADWYEFVFGMKRWLDTPFTLSGRGLAIGDQGDQTRLIIMQCKDPVIGMLGLLEWVKPKQQFPPVPERVMVGAPIFVVAAEDTRGIYLRAGQTSARLFTEPYEWSFAAPDGSLKEMLSCSFFDLDGYFFEVNQTK